jgi:hypothetical protein
MTLVLLLIAGLSLLILGGALGAFMALNTPPRWLP